LTGLKYPYRRILERRGTRRLRDTAPTEGRTLGLKETAAWIFVEIRYKTIDHA
jgi:hypothetical protein